jgi:hypothetical protein
MSNLTKERAQEIKEQVLDKISDHIPSSLVNKVWETYLEVINPTNRHAECTCNPKAWNAYITTLRERVNEALMAQTIVVEQQEIVEKQDPLAKLQAQAKQRHKK